MKHTEEDKSQDAIFYIVALVSGLFVGGIIGKGFMYIPIGGVLGLLSAVTFIKFIVRGRHNEEV